MSILNILTYPDPFLKEPVKPVENIDDDLLRIIDDMAETMYQAPGVGLAAIQAGIDKSVIVYDPEEQGFRALINPEIIEAEGRTISENEGCLSVPDFRSDVQRFERIVVKGLDRDGKNLKFEATGVLSVILQHEIDHLNGILFIDRISALKRQMYKRKRKKELKNDS
ncbi:MAG: peptide deformylase [Desulfobacteraceae bacterium]|nr:peptide deformylase [Desulfobacteraceae bacterium]MCF8094892.1 peptide deformylase [Desulfobacteraceae bacterium]